MKTDRCRSTCNPERGEHDLGDLVVHEHPSGCLGCGAVGVPHYGFTSPCPASANGAHYFTREAAVRNSR